MLGTGQLSIPSIYCPCYCPPCRYGIPCRSFAASKERLLLRVFCPIEASLLKTRNARDPGRTVSGMAAGILFFSIAVLDAQYLLVVKICIVFCFKRTPNMERRLCLPRTPRTLPFNRVTHNSIAALTPDTHHRDPLCLGLVQLSDLIRRRKEPVTASHCVSWGSMNAILFLNAVFSMLSRALRRCMEGHAGRPVWGSFAAGARGG